jgi:hypothetical protein
VVNPRGVVRKEPAREVGDRRHDEGENRHHPDDFPPPSVEPLEEEADDPHAEEDEEEHRRPVVDLVDERAERDVARDQGDRGVRLFRRRLVVERQHRSGRDEEEEEQEREDSQNARPARVGRQRLRHRLAKGLAQRLPRVELSGQEPEDAQERNDLRQVDPSLEPTQEGPFPAWIRFHVDPSAQV